MVHISIKDLLWEVKMFAYEFWDVIIQKLVKKSSIQNDTDKLYDSLIELSKTGCLHVSWLINLQCLINIYVYIIVIKTIYLYLGTVCCDDRRKRFSSSKKSYLHN